MHTLDKMILSAGIAILVLGIGFLMVGSMNNSLSSAYTTGGYLWLIVGATTLGLGFKVRQTKKQQLGALR